jgi:hypothetical protein
VNVKRKSTYNRRALSFLDRVDVVVVDVDVIDADEGAATSTKTESVRPWLANRDEVGEGEVHAYAERRSSDAQMIRTRCLGTQCIDRCIAGRFG